jgi:hypothetical protein
MAPEREAGDGREDFDFIHGGWHVAHRSLADRADPDCDVWERFEGTATAWPILGGLGNVDRIMVPERPGASAYEGCSFRLFEPRTRTWRIFWTSTARPGELDPPVEGRFADGVGRFEGADELGGRAVRVRFEWTDITATGARWQQFFSFDGGGTWKDNWTMDWTRTA